MKIVLNDASGVDSFDHALELLLRGAAGISAAVSYIQVGGWEILKTKVRHLPLHKVQIVFTEQMGITHPAAIRQALQAGVQIRRYTGDHTFHPKVYLALDDSGHPMRFLVASANLSHSAFAKGIEAGLIGDDSGVLRDLAQWFEDLFQHRSVNVTEKWLQDMEETWRPTAAQRVRARLKVRRKRFPPWTPGVSPITPSDLDVLEDVFATIRLPIGLLNMDYAGNNVRNVAKGVQVLATWRKQPSRVGGKQRSEMKLLGFSDGMNLTPLGQAASRARTQDSVARLWCDWLKRTSDVVLHGRNSRLLVARRVFPQFWRLKAGVRQYFLKNVRNRRERRVLQTIELLCNASDVVQELTLEDFKTLAPMIDQIGKLPQYIQDAVENYKTNKGTRGWELPDRMIVTKAWKR